jgi:transcriptional regulator with XRE-family HTH domain
VVILVNGAQARAARALLGLAQDQVAKAAGIGISTLRRIEANDGAPEAHANTMVQLWRFYDQNGIEFPFDDRSMGVLKRLNPS